MLCVLSVVAIAMGYTRKPMSPSRFTNVAVGSLAVLTLYACDGSTTSPKQPAVYDFDFEVDTTGWQAGFADYPVGREDDVGFIGEVRDRPDTLTVGRALYQFGDNISDDLFMYFARQVDGLEPNTTYRASFHVEFASNHGQDCMFGVGSSVYIKAGVSPIEPDVDADSGMMRMNIDKGQQHNSGAHALLLGDVRNDQPGCSDDAPYSVSVRESGEETLTVQSDANGRIWLILATESAFESPHELYFTRLQVQLIESTSN